MEIYLDSAAKHSLFHSAHVLSAVCEKKYPYTMKRVERDSKGIKVGREGYLRDLGCVDVAQNAVANILSQGELVDAGFCVTYDSDADE